MIAIIAAFFLKIFALIGSICGALILWAILREFGDYIFIVLAVIVIYSILT